MRLRAKSRAPLDPYVQAMLAVQAEIDRRQKQQMLIAAHTPKAANDGAAANDNLLSGFKLFPKFQFLIEGNLGSCSWRALWGGRGTAKSWQVADAAIWWGFHKPGLRIAFVRKIAKDLDESCRALVRKRLQHWGLLDVVVREVDGKFIFDNGTEILFIGLWKGKNLSGIKSLEGINLTIIEEAQEISEAMLEILEPTVMRTPMSEIWAMWNPRSAKDAIDALLRGPLIPDDAKVVRVHANDNPEFPARMAKQRELAYKKNPIRAAHIWEGEYEPSAEGAIWDRATLDAATNAGAGLDQTMIKRIVVAVDPNGGGKDVVGIVAAAELFSQTDGIPDSCILGDYSMASKVPSQWGAMVKKVADGWGADCIVVETNFGGDMCKFVLSTAGITQRIETVHASRGKHVRAEPIAALYDQGRVWHYRPFPELEEQYLHMTPQGYALGDSPGNLDAAVFALTEIYGGAKAAAAKVHRRA